MTPAILLAALLSPAVELPAGPGPLRNPLKGYAAYSAPGTVHSMPVSMAYADASWAELEPKEGEYRFAEWERNEWDTPLAKDKHIVFRVWMDYPSQPVGVPQWLVDKGVKLNPYTDFGGGKSPDYEDPRLQEALLRLIRKLGERYDTNPRVAFVQVGLLGHWGEFHTWPREELFASEATQRKVVNALRTAFPHKKLMGRNPAYASLRLPDIGFHDDMIPEDTLPPDEWKFLPSLRAAKLDENWRVAPTGGEMVPGAAKKWLGEGWEDTLRSVHDVHFSWIGPYCPAIEPLPKEQFRQRGEELIRKLGYEFRLTRYTAKATAGKLRLSIQGVNQGVAPFYYPWPVEVAIIDGAGKVAAKANLPADIRKWLPGAFTLTGTIPAPKKAGQYRIGIGIVDPWRNRPSVAFANRLPNIAGYTILGNVKMGGR